MRKTKWSAPAAAPSVLLLSGVTLACLLPFIGKAFHIDDPLFIWCARHVETHPLDFYGFTVNWEDREMSMAAVTQNPPLASYYLALVGALFGWSEVALHGGFLVAALAAVAGTFFLAQRLCAHPLAAALTTITAPVFLLAGASVMCDTMMLAFWVWAVVFWMRGLEEERALHLLAAAVLVALGVLTKYFALSLIPLLLVYSLIARRRAGPWLGYLGIPVVVSGLYQWATYRMYGRGLLSSAASYATFSRVGGDLPSKCLVGLAFVGGCLVVFLPATPLLWGRKGVLLGGVSVAALGLAVVITRRFGPFDVVDGAQVKWSFVAHFAVFAAVGASLLLLAAADVRRDRASGAALLFLWIAGTFVFASFVNWTVSGRNVLPMLPAASVLLVRRMEARGSLRGDEAVGRLVWPLAISLAIALSIGWADWRWANSVRAAAQSLGQTLRAGQRALWFQGHWGFQYYMEKFGAKPLDGDRLQLAAGDVLVLPPNNSYQVVAPADRVVLAMTPTFESVTWLTTMNVHLGAGYYSDGFGPLPFMFGPIPEDTYYVFRVK